MNRRAFIFNAGLAVAAALGILAEARAEPRRHPNIVYILVDDLGYGDLACFNPKSKIPTPNINRLAREGMRFTDAHSGSAMCTPTRYGILTGRYAWRTHLKEGVTWGYSPALIAVERLTVPSLLKRYNYRTAGIGKWHLGFKWASKGFFPASEMNVDFTGPITHGPTARGFDYYYGIPASLDMEPYVYIENDRVEEVPTQAVGGRTDPGFYRAGMIASGFHHIEVLPRLTDKAVACITDHAANHKNQPLFLYFSLTAPHTPFMPTKEFRGKSGIGIYGDFVCQIDATVGRVLEALDKAGMAKDTLFIFTSDNGCTPKADFEALKKHGHNPNYHFRGCKADIYEGGHRVPFIVRWPGQVKAGTACDQTICLTDLMATAADVVGAKLFDTAGEDSVSFLPALKGKAKGPLREATVHHSMDGYFAIRQGKWKLAFCRGSGGWSDPMPYEARKMKLPPVQLYDLSQDPGETTNLEAKHPEVVKRLKVLLQKYIDEGRSTPGKPRKNEGRTSLWGPG